MVASFAGNKAGAAMGAALPECYGLVWVVCVVVVVVVGSAAQAPSRAAVPSSAAVRAGRNWVFRSVMVVLLSVD